MRLIILFLAFINLSAWGNSTFKKICNERLHSDKNKLTTSQIEWIKKILNTDDCEKIELKIRSLRSISSFSPRFTSNTSNTSIFKPFELTNQSIVPTTTKDQEPSNFYNDLSLFREFQNLTHLYFDPSNDSRKNFCSILSQLPTIQSITVNAGIEFSQNEIGCIKEANLQIYIAGIYSKTSENKSVIEHIYGIENFQADYGKLHLFKNLRFLGIEKTSSQVNLNELVTIQRLSNLYLNSKHLKNVRNISKIKNLKFLTLNCFELKDDTSEFEVCNKNAISDIDFIKSLTTLQGLDLSWNRITDFSQIENLPKLQYLNLRENNISEIPDVKIISNLKYLNLAKNNIHNLGHLQKAKNLESINLSFNKIESLKNLETLKKLRFLSIGGNPINNYSPISSLPALIALNISDIYPRTLSTILDNEVKNLLSTHMTNEDKIYLNNFLTEDTEKLLPTRRVFDAKNLNVKNLKSLNILLLTEMNFSKLPEINRLNQLRYLDLANTKTVPSQSMFLPRNIQVLNLQNSHNLVDFNLLQAEKLEVLDISSNKGILLDLNFKKLRMLFIKNCSLDESPHISHLSQLEYLDISGNNLHSFDNYSSPNLAILDLSNNPINEVPDFSNLKNLYSVFLYNSPISSLANVNNGNVIFEFFNNPINKDSSVNCPKDSLNKSIRDFCNSN